MELQKNSPWYEYLDECQRELVNVSFSLTNKKNELVGLKDYSFIVFPMAKAYEGFLKKLFLDLQLISKETYEGRRFRIGRALNPDIRSYQRDDDWLYDNVSVRFGEEMARQLWETWLTCRNRVFHYFSDCEEFLDFDEACKRIKVMEEAMQAVANKLDKRQNYGNAI
jgi:hypothetical protein